VQPVTTATVAVFQGPGRPFELREVPLPELATGELLVAISLATICGSDLHTCNGRRPEPTPTVLGHEAVGRVVALGPGRDPALLGRRVTWSLVDTCGCCRPCRDWGLPQKCDQLFKYGHAPMTSGSGLNGCYASHLVIRAGTTVIALPDSVDDATAAPANCALATMVAATEPLAEGGETALVQGAGLLGLYGCALLGEFGWKRVLVTDLNADRLAVAGRFGAEPISAAELAGLRPSSVDAVLEVAGAAAVVPEGLRLVRPGGHYGFVGMVHPDTRLELTGETVVRKCLTLRGTHNYAPRHLQAAADFLGIRSSRHPWPDLVADPLPLAGLDEAFRLAHTGRWARVSVVP
jgi:putative phosphonate catabolism associated alcohol dehydrogenase